MFSQEQFLYWISLIILRSKWLMGVLKFKVHDCPKQFRRVQNVTCVTARFIIITLYRHLSNAQIIIFLTQFKIIGNFNKELFALHMHKYSLVPKERHVRKEGNDSTLDQCIVPKKSPG